MSLRVVPWVCAALVTACGGLRLSTPVLEDFYEGDELGGVDLRTASGLDCSYVRSDSPWKCSFLAGDNLVRVQFEGSELVLELLVDDPSESQRESGQSRRVVAATVRPTDLHASHPERYAPIAYALSPSDEGERRGLFRYERGLIAEIHEPWIKSLTRAHDEERFLSQIDEPPDEGWGPTLYGQYRPWAPKAKAFDESLAALDPIAAEEIAAIARTLPGPTGKLFDARLAAAFPADDAQLGQLRAKWAETPELERKYARKAHSEAGPALPQLVRRHRLLLRARHHRAAGPERVVAALCRLAPEGQAGGAARARRPGRAAALMRRERRQPL